MWWWSSSPGTLWNVRNPFIAITPRSTLAQSGSTCQCLLYGSNRTVWPFNCVQTNNWYQIELLVLPYLPNLSARAGYDTRSIFKRSLTGFNSEFSFSWSSYLTKAEEPSLPYYLPIAGGRIIGIKPFLRVLGLCEMQSVSSIIWTCVAVSIS